MDVTALLAVDFFLKRSSRKSKIWIGAFILSLCETLLLLFCGNKEVYLVLTHFLLVPLTNFCVFGWGSWKRFLENGAVSYLMMLLLGGIREWVWEQSYFSKGGMVEYGVSVGVFLVVLRYLAQKRAYGSHEYEVSLKYGEHKIQLKAYLDSGNQLRDIYTGKMVHIIAEKNMQELFQGKEMPFRFVPYTVLGKTDGWIRVVTIDEMILQLEGKEKRIASVVLGIAENGELEGVPFEVILHADVLREE